MDDKNNVDHDENDEELVAMKKRVAEMVSGVPVKVPAHNLGSGSSKTARDAGVA